MQLNVALGPLALFAFVASITPGPNNFLLMRSGARFGVRRSVSHMLGIQAGMVLLIWMSHLGVGALLLAVPATMLVLHWACFAYLLWLALVILRDARREPELAESRTADTARPMTLLQAMTFQLINPKAWIMAVTTVSAFYRGAPTWLDLVVITLLCTLIGSNSMLVWNIWGAAIDRMLTQPRARQLFGYCMSALVVATAFWMLR
jgi:threonine/homoserine/homoserine lactone efflux protein